MRARTILKQRMLEQLWSGRSRLYLLLVPFSLMYAVLSNFIRLTYRWGWRKLWLAPVPVVVVGNITVGGTGKTPLVIWLVNELHQRGLRVGVVSRGYGGKAPMYPFILSTTTSPEEAGDEPVLISKRTGVPVAVSPSRPEAVKALLAAHRLDVVISDDGLQHYALGRDLEIVVVDAERRFGNGWLLPAGPLRERASRLKHVDAVVFRGENANTEEGDKNNNKNCFVLQLRPGKAINLKNGTQVEPAELPSVVAMAGIGYPPRFFRTLRQCGVIPVKEIPFADHQHYTASSLSTLAEAHQTLLMTEKDAVKCFAFGQENWWYLPVDAVLSPHADKLVAKIADLCTARKPSI